MSKKVEIPQFIIDELIDDAIEDWISNRSDHRPMHTVLGVSLDVYIAWLDEKISNRELFTISTVFNP